MRAYHETYNKVVDKIQLNGIETCESCDTVETETFDERYVEPDDSLRTTREYAHVLINTVLRRMAPDQYPRRTRGVWMFNQHDMEETKLGRNTILEIDFDSVLANHTVVAVPWDIAKDTYWETMDRFEIAEDVPVETLHNKCERYWDAATVVESVEDVPNELCEMYTNTSVLDPAHIEKTKHLPWGGA